MMCNYVDFEGVCTITNALCKCMSEDTCSEYFDEEGNGGEPNGDNTNE